MKIRLQERELKSGRTSLRSARAMRRTAAESAHEMIDRAAQEMEDRQGIRRTPLEEARQNAEAIARSSAEAGRSAYRAAQNGARRLGTTLSRAQRQARSAQQAAKASVRTARKAAQKARELSRTAARIAVHVGRAVLRALRRAFYALTAAIAAGGWTAVIIIVLICFVGMVASSPYGVFLSNEDASTMLMRDMISLMSDEYQRAIEQIQQQYPHDRMEVVANDGVTAVRWDEVLSVYAVLLTTDPENPTEVVTSSPLKIDRLREILFEMNELHPSLRTESHTVQVEKTDENGDPVMVTEVVTETVLTIQLQHKSSEDMIRDYRLDEQQSALLRDMLSPAYSALWAHLLGGFSAGIGIIDSSADWIPTGPFVWPLPINGSFNSGFVYRIDPISGEYKFHGGVDLGAPAGTPIRAAADGVVITANGVDSWGGGYGYHVRLSHADGYETLYAHCSSICVQYGQQVRQGEVIGYVGTTGYSTGNHLHFEVWENGSRIDPLLFFK